MPDRELVVEKERSDPRGRGKAGDFAVPHAGFSDCRRVETASNASSRISTASMICSDSEGSGLETFVYMSDTRHRARAAKSTTVAIVKCGRAAGGN